MTTGVGIQPNTGPVSGAPVSGSVYGGPRPTAARPVNATVVAPRPPRKPGTIGGLPVANLLCWQLAVAGVAMTVHRGPVPIAVAGGLAAITLLLTAVRIRRRWLYQALAAWLRFQFRTRVAEAAPYVDPRAALLDFLSPATLVTTVEVDGENVGVIEHAAGVTAILELGALDTGLVAEAPLVLPSPASLLPPADPHAPPLTLQLLIQATPAPSALASGAAAASYRQLTEGRIPATRRAWIAIRLCRDGATHSEADLRQALGSAARRLIRRLRQDSVDARALDRDDTLAAIGTLAHLPPVAAPTAARGSARVGVATVGVQHTGPVGYETWNTWWSGETAQATLRLRRWPDPRTEAGQHLLSTILAAPGLATTVSLAARRVDVRPADLPPEGEADLVAVELGIRLAAQTGPLLDGAAAALTGTLRSAGAIADRLGGEQAAGLAATLPLGGFLQ